MNFKYLAGVSAVAVALPLFVNGCASKDALCCTDFQPGKDMSQVNWGVDAKINGQFTVLAQTVGDISSAADDMLKDVGNACRNIAIDLGATNEDQKTNDALTSTKAVEAWCSLAVAKLTAKGTLNFTIKAEAPKCEASFKAEASCQGRCDVSGKCDVEATPPTCEGGTLEVQCSAKCDVTAKAPTISCKGVCSGQCSGSCQATAQAPKVECTGTCQGTCEAGGAAGGSGIQADGSCKGTCSGTCTTQSGSVSVQCQGRCEGSCNASCDVQPGTASVQCDGSCSAKATPLECKGGTLKASCEVKAECAANCKASAEARASCTPGQLTIEGNTQGLEDIVATLKTNLPLLLTAIKVRGEAIVKATGSIKIDGVISGDLGVKGTACIASMVSSFAIATDNAVTAGKAGGSVAGTLKI